MKFVAKSYEAPPPGVYRATLKDVEERTSDDGKPFYLWRFEIETKTGKTTVSRPTSTASGPKAVARGIIEALLDRQLTPGEEIYLRNLVDLPCTVVVERAFRADGSEVARVTSVLPASFGD
jgi:hypothetical protein